MDALQFPEIQTRRLVLRKLKESDWEVVSFLRTDKEVNKFVDRPTAENRVQALEFIAKITTAVDTGFSFYWAISRKDDEQMIGSICLWNFSGDRTYAEVGYDLSPGFQGLGIMDEALNAILDFGFTKLSLNTIEAFTHKHNEPSKKLLIKNGFMLVAGKSDPDNANNLIFAIKKPTASNKV
jgi:ribosomal-protein-alanine N-acetyltransferase